MKPTYVLVWLCVPAVLVGCAGNSAPGQQARQSPTGQQAKPDPSPEQPAVADPAMADEWPPVTEVADADEAFDRLTAHIWGDREGSHVLFRRDGAYRWYSMPDPLCGTPNFDRQGKWSLRWFATHGCVVLDSGAALAIQFRGDGLFFIERMAPRGQAIEYTDDERRRTRRDLPLLEPLPLAAQLTRHGWRKSDEFNLFMYATRIRFTGDARFLATYRHGECQHGGFWSVVPETRGGGRRVTMLVPRSDPNTCDLRGPGEAAIAASNEEPQLRDGMLVFFGSSYYPEDGPTGGHTFTFDRYGNSVRVTGRCTGRFRVGEPKEIEVTFENTDLHGSPKRLDKLRITQQRIQFEGNGAADKPQVLRETLLGFTLKETGSREVRRIQITPAVAGEHVHLNFELDYADSRQSYHAYQGYAVNVSN
jgi:hypothetical protein